MTTAYSVPKQNVATDVSHPRDPSTQSAANNVVLSLISNVLLYIIRLYVICFIMAIGWAKKLAFKFFAPLEPIAAQVRKVPKKDVSIEGILYQFFRLQFLILLYMAPWINKSFAYVTEPVGRLAQRVLDWVGLDDQVKTRKTRD